MSIPDFGGGDDTPFAEELKLIGNFKKAILMASGAAAQKLMMQLEHEQEVLMHIADMGIVAYHAESLLLRVMKLVAQKGEAACSLQLDMMRTYLYDAADAINKSGKDALNAFAGGDEQRMMLLGLKRFTKAQPFDSKSARRRIADAMIAAGKYCFE
jgi:precorrin-6x reductase